MRVRTSTEFIKQYKKAGKKIRDKVDKIIILFSKNPKDASLRNHSLKGKYEGYRSIDITGDWRAIYKEVKQDNTQPFAYFTYLGTHSQLYK